MYVGVTTSPFMEMQPIRVMFIPSTVAWEIGGRSGGCATTCELTFFSVATQLSSMFRMSDGL